MFNPEEFRKKKAEKQINKKVNRTEIKWLI